MIEQMLETSPIRCAAHSIWNCSDCRVGYTVCLPIMYICVCYL